MLRRFSVLAFILAIAQLCQCYENYTLSKDNSRMCFPVYVNKGQKVSLDLSLLEYEPLPGLSAEENKTNVAVILYRHQELNYEKVFVGDSNVHQLCNDEAIERGYCEPKHKGKILFEYKEDGDYQGNAFNEIFHELESYQDAHQLGETGFYCARALGFKAKKFKLEILINDGLSTTGTQRRDLLTTFFKFFGLVSLGVFYYSKWFKWSRLNDHQKIPYLVKLLLINIVLQTTYLMLDIIMIILGANARKTVMYICFHYLHTLISDFDEVALVFYLYQYSGNFTYDSFQFEYKKVFTFLYLIEIAPDFLDPFATKIFESQKNPDGTDGDFLQLCGVIYLIIVVLLGIFYFILKIRTLMRYYRSSKEYTDFGKSDDPRFAQFKWLILTRLFMNYFGFFFEATMMITFGILHMIPFYKSNFMFDEGKFAGPQEFYFETFLKHIIVLSVKYFVLLRFWTPEYFVKAKNYKPIE